MGKCELCDKQSTLTSTFLGVCRSCIIDRPEKALAVTEEKHTISKSRFSLPYPKPSKGVACGLCGNDCKILEGEVGFCGLSKNDNGRLIRPGELVAEGYYDPHPTNCVPMNFCGASGAGYPEYSYRKSREIGYYNLSVFCVGCSYDCSFCQNWHYREMVNRKENYGISKRKFESMIHRKVSCICFFGGDPCVQLGKISDYCREAETKNEILRFCLETSGNFNQELLKEFAEISLRSGGGIKFDLKFWNPTLNIAITGVDNKNSYECFRMLGELHRKRPKVPFLRASTLLVPGYITPNEVEQIAKFIANVNHDIPYFLLAYSPGFEMRSLPFTSKKLAYECKERATKHLEKVRIGNRWLLI